MPSTPKTPRQPQPFKVSRWTVQRKLVLAFWLVSVIPTMIAAELAATTLSQIFDSNVRVWLQESTKIVKDEISEILADNARAAKLLLQHAHPPSSSKAIRHDRLTADIAEAMGIDVVALIRDSDHKVIFSTASDTIVDQISLSPNAVLQTINVGGVPTGTVVSTFATSQDGVNYQLLVATYMDSSFLTSVADVHSLDLRLYLSNTAGFAEIFSSQRFEDRQLMVPGAIEQTLRETRQPSEQFTSRYSGLYWPILNDTGELQGVIYSGLLRHSSLVGLVNQSNLFALIFLVGSVL
ncbi:MAG: two-component sensor histidine kinase, partial [Pseudomonas sp.]|nr:two-component sensor histidine kinase [Pseudomonas sp.]